MLINEGKSNRKLPKIFVGKNLWMTQKKRYTLIQSKRPVIVKFVRCSTRKLIFKNKKKLKGSKINITANLTAKRMKKLQTARKKQIWKRLDARIICWGAVSDRVRLYYIIINVYSWHAAMLETERKNCLVSFLLLFLFCPSCLLFGIRHIYFFSYVCLMGKHL